MLYGAVVVRHDVQSDAAHDEGTGPMTEQPGGELKPDDGETPESTGQAAPGSGSESADPWATSPQRPDQPDQPDQPDRAGQPEEPSWGQPDQPDQPDQPEEPSRGQPDQPDQPDQAGQPEEPSWGQPGQGG